MPHDPFESLSRRERQIMDVLYAKEKATVDEIRGELPDPPTNSSVRALLNIMAKSGLVTHVQVGLTNVYRPVVPRRTVAKSIAGHVLKTFFDGSVEQAVTALLSSGDRSLSDEELDQIQRLIDEAREQDSDPC